MQRLCYLQATLAMSVTIARALALRLGCLPETAPAQGPSLDQHTNEVHGTEPTGSPKCTVQVASARCPIQGSSLHSHSSA